MYQKGNKEIQVMRLYLGDYLKRLFLREISRLSGLALKTTQRILGNLEKARILKSEISGKNKYFFLNMDNIETKPMLLQAEIFQTMQFVEKYPVFKSFLKEIKNISEPIIIFGSFAKFTSSKDSDVDMLLISDKKTGLPFHLLPNRVHEINLSENQFFKASKKGELLIKKIEENHVILNNHSFFVNFMWEKYAR